MNLDLQPSFDKDTALKNIEKYILDLSLEVAEIDKSRPWGGEFIIDVNSIDIFIKEFFPNIDHRQITKYGKLLRPKFLVIAPNQQFSWQYHRRRAELWRVTYGPVGIVLSEDDELTPVKRYEQGEITEHDRGVRHRLVGLDNWGIIAEIWQHTDPAHPSDNDDIVRLQDIYGRS